MPHWAAALGTVLADEATSLSRRALRLHNMIEGMQAIW